MDVCDQASIMRGGKILRTGLPSEVIEDLTPKEKNKMLSNGKTA